MTPFESQRVAGGPASIPVPLEVNGRRHVVELEPRVGPELVMDPAGGGR